MTLQSQSVPPRVFCISGHDPSGGAGLQADIEAINNCGGFAQVVPTCLTVQNQLVVRHSEAVSTKLFKAMYECLLETGRPAAVKIGLLDNTGLADELATWLADLAPLPVVLDPVLRASSGHDFGDRALIQAMRERLFTHSTVITPNRTELQRLAGMEDMDEAARSLLALGVGHVLVTGGDADTDAVENCLYSGSLVPKTWTWPRLPYACHGSGCTLASSLAAFLARGLKVAEACERAQAYTQETLSQAIAYGDGPRIPRRKTGQIS